MNIEKLVEILELLLIEESYNLGIKLMEEEASKVKNIEELDFEFDSFKFRFFWDRAWLLENNIDYISLVNLSSDKLSFNKIEFYSYLGTVEKSFIYYILYKWKNICLK